MSKHFIKKCTCGAIVAQCRCIGEKEVEIVSGCEQCKFRGFKVPRRADLLQFTSAEKAIYEAVGEVEKVGTHPLLTDAVILLQQAREKVADFVDKKF